MKSLKRNQGSVWAWLLIIIVITIFLIWKFGAQAGEVSINQTTNPVSVTVGGTYDSKYMFRGVKLIDGGLLSTDASISLYGFTATAWWAVGAEKRYQELDLTLGYSHTVGPFTLSGGYVYYYYPKGDNVPNSQEFNVGASLPFLKYFTASSVYTYDFDAIKGGYLENKISADFPLTKAPVSLDLQPYLLGSVDFGYNSNKTALNAVQFGSALNIGFGEHFSVAPYIAYEVPLAAIRDIQSEVWWAGIRLQVTY